MKILCTFCVRFAFYQTGNLMNIAFIYKFLYFVPVIDHTNLQNKHFFFTLGLILSQPTLYLGEESVFHKHEAERNFEPAGPKAPYI